MTAPHANQLIDGYLARIQAAAVDLPASARSELLDDIRSHIAEARSREPEETDASILNILDRLGEPDAVVAEARQRPDTAGSGRTVTLPSPYRPGILEIAALILLPFFWFIGVILLWVSPAWSLRDKIIGSLLPPGGYFGLFIIGVASGHHAFGLASNNNTGSPPVEVIGTVLSGLLVIAIYLLPLITVAYLAVRLRWGQSTQVATG
jgi:uncharacterized membrane protein